MQPVWNRSVLSSLTVVGLLCIFTFLIYNKNCHRFKPVSDWKDENFFAKYETKIER